MKPSPVLACLPADLPSGSAWRPDERGWELWDGDRALARLDEPSGDGAALAGRIGGVEVRVRLAGRRHPRLRLLTADGRELAGFAPDWSGVGPIDTADGARYGWIPAAWSPRGGQVRDGAGAVVLAVTRAEGTLERRGTLPDGHAVVLAVLTWAMALLEAGDPTRVLRVGAPTGRDAEEWM